MREMKDDYTLRVYSLYWGKTGKGKLTYTEGWSPQSMLFGVTKKIFLTVAAVGIGEAVGLAYMNDWFDGVGGILQLYDGNSNRFWKYDLSHEDDPHSSLRFNHYDNISWLWDVKHPKCSKDGCRSCRTIKDQQMAEARSLLAVNVRHLLPHKSVIKSLGA